MMSSTPAESPLAVSTTMRSTPASFRATARSQASPKKPMAAPTRRRPDVVLGGVGVLLALVEVLDGDEPAQAPILVDERELLDLVLREDRDGGVGVDALRRGDERRLGHDVAHERGGLLERRDEPHVAVGDDADELAVVLDDRKAGDPELAAQRIHLGDGRVRRRRDRVGDHARLGALHLVDVRRPGLRSTGCDAGCRCRRCAPWRSPCATR